MPCLKNSDGMGFRSFCSDKAEFYIACILWGKNAGRGKKMVVQRRGAQAQCAPPSSILPLKVVGVLNGSDSVIGRAGVAAENIGVNFFIVHFVAVRLVFSVKMPLRLGLFCLLKSEGHIKSSFR